MAATAAPMFLGVLWRGSSRLGALTGFLVGGVAFSVLHGVGFGPTWLGTGDTLQLIAQWLQAQKVNPFACATIGGGCSIVSMMVVSFYTEKPDPAHLDRVFGEK